MYVDYGTVGPYTGLYAGVIDQVNPTSVVINWEDFDEDTEISQKEYKAIKTREASNYVEHKNNDTDLTHALNEGVPLPTTMRYFAI